MFASHLHKVEERRVQTQSEPKEMLTETELSQVVETVHSNVVGSAQRVRSSHLTL
jgi:hypothetical protein